MSICAGWLPPVCAGPLAVSRDDRRPLLLLLHAQRCDGVMLLLRRRSAGFEKGKRCALLHISFWSMPRHMVVHCGWHRGWQVANMRLLTKFPRRRRQKYRSSNSRSTS